MRNVLLKSSAWHQCTAVPALFEPALDQLAAHTLPAPLWHVLQIVQQFASPRFLLVMHQPDLRQALVRWQLARHADQELALHARRDTFVTKGIGPQRGDGEVGGLGESQHPTAA